MHRFTLFTLSLLVFLAIEPKILQWVLEIMLVTGLVWFFGVLSDYVARLKIFNREKML